jgi:putative heme-binding domain-containing protein
VDTVRFAAVDALAGTDVKAAAVCAAKLLGDNPGAEVTRAIVTPFLGRQGGDAVLAAALSNTKLAPETATAARSVLIAAGRQSAALDKVLAPGDTNTVGQPAYSEAYINALVKEVAAGGDAKRGKTVYNSGAVSCAACHKIGDTGGVLGPELTVIGAGMSTELIIESVLWPKRQVKEGYLSTTLTTKDGKVVSGYVDTETKAKIVIRDAATGTKQALRTADVASRQDAGTLMPPGLAATLTRDQLRDMIAYLAALRGRL